MLQFVALALAWGSSFVFVSIALGTFTFWQTTWLRIVLAALTLGLVVLLTRSRLPREKGVYLHFLVIGAAANIVPNLGYAYGLTQVSAGVVAMYASTSGLAAALLSALVFKIERLTPLRVLPVVIGAAGVLVIIGPWAGVVADSLTGQLASLAAAVSYAASLAYARRFVTDRDIPVLTMAFLNVAGSAVLLLPFTPVMLLPLPVEPRLVAVLAMVWVAAVPTGIAQLWNLNVLRRWGPVATSTVTYLLPVVASALGLVLLGEALTWNEMLGAGIIIAALAARQFMGPAVPRSPAAMAPP